MPLGDPIPTFTVYAKTTGEPLLADEYTFNPEWHSRVPLDQIEAPADVPPKSKSKKAEG